MANFNPKFTKNSFFIDLSRKRSNLKFFVFFVRNSGSQILIRFFKLRTSNQKLPIECGRWKNIERNRRLCKLCQKQEIGDGFHYIMECSFFKCKRKLVIKQKYTLNPNMKQLKNLMTSKNRKKLTNICKLIKEIDNGVCAPG